MSRAKAWVFTINNYAEEDEPRDWAVNEQVKWCCWQAEEGEGGTPHLQGYLVLRDTQRLSWIKSNIHGTAHWEVRRGTHQEAKDYATKLDTRKAGPWAYGDEPAGRGARSDLAAVKRLLDEGATEQAIADEFFGQWIRHHKSFREYKRLRSTNRDWKTTVTVIWGPTGTGKSRWAADNHLDAYWKPRGLWFDGYDGHTAVVIDEFYGWLPYDLLLRMLDRYPLLVEVKGGTVNFVPRDIVILSNKHPREWYDNTKCPYPPLGRRIDKLYFLGELGGLMVCEDPSLSYEAVEAALAPLSPDLNVYNPSEDHPGWNNA